MSNLLWTIQDFSIKFARYIRRILFRAEVFNWRQQPHNLQVDQNGLQLGLQQRVQIPTMDFGMFLENCLLNCLDVFIGTLFTNCPTFI
jgi:hypothetical protein